MHKITLKEIAEKLNISVTTVSKALKNYPDVSKKTKKKVKKIAKELNYIPNSAAVNLRTKETKTLGVIVPTTVHHFFSNVIKGILEVATKNGYLVILLQSDEKYTQEKKLVELLINKHVDGIMISLSNDTRKTDHLESIIKHSIPLILFDKISKNVQCTKVTIDDKEAAYNAVTYLIQKGYKNIAHFRGHLNPQLSIDRFLGYKQALEDHGLKFNPDLVFVCDNNSDFDDGYNAANQLIKNHHVVDALFTITDVVAIGAIKYFNDNNISIPQDIAVFGFSNWFMSSVVNPSLSTVKQPGYTMGKTTANLLIDEIKCNKKKQPIAHKNVVLSTELIIRDSC